MLDLRVAGDPADLLASLRDLGPSVSEPLLVGSTVSVARAGTSESLTERVNALAPSRLGVRTMTVRPTTLNDVFLILTTRRAPNEHQTAPVTAGRRA